MQNTCDGSRFLEKLYAPKIRIFKTLFQILNFLK